MAKTSADRLLSTAPSAALPDWPLAWANIWADQLGTLHWSRHTHGTVFEEAFERAYGRSVGTGEADWMFEHTGSVGDVDDADDNPGWQFNQLATGLLGWIRIQAKGLDGLQPRFTVTFAEAATKEALQAAARLLPGQSKDSTVEVSAYGGFAEKSSRAAGLAELRDCISEAPAGSLEPPDCGTRTGARP